MNPISAMLARGGTSKVVFFNKQNFPKQPHEIQQKICKLMGSGTPGQIDGLGTGSTLGSKVFLVSPHEGQEADVRFTFYQVGVDSQMTDSAVLCGNGVAALPLYAIHQGWIKKPGNLRAYNETTGEYLDFTWGSNPQEVSIILHNPCGQNTCPLYPTKKAQDKIYIPQFDSEIPVTILNAVGPIIFARAEDLLLTGFETPQELAKHNLAPIIETIREEACNLADLEYNANSTVPKFCLIASPTNGAHLAVRYFTPHEPHPSLAVSASIAIGTALLMKGTILNELCPKDIPLSPAEFSIEHPAGITHITLDYKCENALPHIQRAMYQKSARVLMAGDVWLD